MPRSYRTVLSNYSYMQCISKITYSTIDSAKLHCTVAVTSIRIILGLSLIYRAGKLVFAREDVELGRLRFRPRYANADSIRMAEDICFQEWRSARKHGTCMSVSCREEKRASLDCCKSH